MTLQDNLTFITLEQAKRAILLAFFCDVPIAIWGAPGIGKSTMVKDLAKRLQMRVYDFRVSDKSKEDLGGVPYPIKLTIIDPDGTKREVVGGLEYLLAKGLLPFDTDERCIVFFDEADRTDDPGVRNAVQQIFLDRIINGHPLSVNARIVIAGNGTSDIDTTELSRAANGRMVHTYIENESAAALDSWLGWADEEVPADPDDPESELIPQASALLRAFAKTNHKTWVNGAATSERMLKEQAEPTNRTWVYADKFIRAADNPEIEFRTSDILLPLVAGCVGKGAAQELLSFRDMFASAPSIEEILADPENAAVPERLDILAALTYSLTDQATRDRATGEAIATYGLRWPEEPAAFLFRRLLEKQALVATTDPFQKWSHKRLGDNQTGKVRAEYENWLPELAVVFAGSKPVPENDQWINRLQIPSRSNPNGNPYVLSQNRKDKHWACSCPGFIHRKNCDHVKRIPAKMRHNDPTFAKSPSTV